MTPNLYDLLDVDETATADEIRAAWKAAIADLEPTDRRFRVFNDAAAVLLDPEKRATYDADLASERAAEEAAVEEAAVEEAEAKPSDEPKPSEDRPPAVATAQDAVRRGPATGTLIAVGVAAALAVALLIWVLTLPGTTADASPQEREEESSDVTDTTSSAEDAAGEIVPLVLSYHYRTFDDDVATARTVMTEEFGDERSALLEDLKKQAVQSRTVVTASLAGTAVTRVADDGERATVVVFVDQDVRKAGAEPTVLRMWVTATLVSDGDGWLLDDMCVEASCGD